MPLRRLLLPTLIALALAFVAGCGSDDGEGASAGTSTGASAGTFPATITHKYGSTTVESAPKRVVVVGLREQDDLLALGIAPVGTTEWFGEDPGAIASWAKAKLGSRPLPTVLTNTDGIDVEKVASLRPDLIVGVYSGMTRDEYSTLSKIAPTIGQPEGVVDYGSSWQQELAMVGTAVGKPQEAKRLQAQVEGQIATAAREHPEFRGKSAVMATTFQGVYVYGPQDARSRLLADLGFSFPDGLRDVGGKDEFGGNISNERVDLLDLDTVVWLTVDSSEIRSVQRNPVYRDLAVRKEQRDLFLDEDDPVYDATTKETVLSIPTLLDGLVPRLANAVDGDPSTSTDAG